MPGDDNDNTPKGQEGINELVASVKALLGKDAGNVNDALIKDNFQLREQKRTLKGQVETLTGKVPAEGSVILTGDDAKAWQGYQALGLNPEEIGTVLTDYDDLSVKVTSRDAAEALGWKPKVLADQIRDKGLSVVMEEVDVEVDKDGKKEKVKRDMPFVLTSDNKKVRLEEFEPLKDLHKSLVMDDGEEGGTGGRTTGGVRMAPQRSATSSGNRGEEGPAKVVSGYLGSRYPRPSQRGKDTEKK